MTTITLSRQTREDLEGLIVRVSSSKVRCRARAVLWLAEGESVTQVARWLDVSRQTVYNWMERFLRHQGPGLTGCLRDSPHPGRPRTVMGVIDPLIAAVIDENPRDLGYRSKFWTERLLMRYLEQAHGIRVCRKSVSQAVDRLRGLRKPSPRSGAPRSEAPRRSQGDGRTAAAAFPQR